MRSGRILLLLLSISLYGSASYHIVKGKQYYPVSTNLRPAKGATSVDSRFHLPVTRLTDRAIDRYAGSGITNEYSRFDPSNADRTRLLLQENSTGNWLLYDAQPPFRKIKRITRIGGDIEPRWDPSNPDVFYAFRNTSLISYNVRTNQIQTIYNFKNDFPSASIVGTGAEGEPSENFRWWTILLKQENGRPVAVVCFDKTTRQVVSRKTSFEYDLDEVEINWVSTTPLTGHPLIGWVYRPEKDPFGSYHRGVIRYDRNWNKISDTLVDGHADVAVGKNNEELLIYQNNANDWVEMVNLANGVRTRLFRIPFPFRQNSTLNLHFSGNILSTSPKKGWALVVADEPEGRNNSWLSNQIVLVELKKNPIIWRIAFNRNIYTGDYYTESFATLSRDGKRIYFQSNWGNGGLATEEYMITLPTNWQNLL